MAYSAFYILLREIMLMLQVNGYVIYSAWDKNDFTTGKIFNDVLAIVALAVTCTNYFQKLRSGVYYHSIVSSSLFHFCIYFSYIYCI